MVTQLALAEPVGAPTLIRQAQTDAQLVDLWLHGRTVHTQDAYRRDVARFLAHMPKPLASVTLADVQAFAEDLGGLAPASQARTLAAVKSLLAFGHRIGYLPVNVGAALRLPKVKNTLAERILPEPDVQRVLALEPNLRNRVLLRLCYAAGLRVSELVGLKWRDLQPRAEGGGQIAVYGKGGKTRYVLLPATVWREVQALAGESGFDPDAPVFRSRKGPPQPAPGGADRRGCSSTGWTGRRCLSLLATPRPR